MIIDLDSRHKGQSDVVSMMSQNDASRSQNFAEMHRLYDQQSEKVTLMQLSQDKMAAETARISESVGLSLEAQKQEGVKLSMETSKAIESLKQELSEKIGSDSLETFRRETLQFQLMMLQKE